MYRCGVVSTNYFSYDRQRSGPHRLPVVFSGVVILVLYGRYANRGAVSSRIPGSRVASYYEYVLRSILLLPYGLVVASIVDESVYALLQEGRTWQSVLRVLYLFRAC